MDAGRAEIAPYFLAGTSLVYDYLYDVGRSSVKCTVDVHGSARRNDCLGFLVNGRCCCIELFEPQLRQRNSSRRTIPNKHGQWSNTDFKGMIGLPMIIHRIFLGGIIDLGIRIRIHSRDAPVV